LTLEGSYCAGPASPGGLEFALDVLQAGARPVPVAVADLRTRYSRIGGNPVRQ
jgi:hypothetical protein